VPPPDLSVSGPGEAGAEGFRHLTDETVFTGWRISVTKSTFRAPDRTEFTRDIVRHPGAVAVVPVTEDRRVLLVRQYRGPVDRELLEIPAGTLDVEGESPEETAIRELEEEVGVHAEHMKLLAKIQNTPGFCDEETYVFLATGLQRSETHREGVEEQFMEVVEIALDDVGAMIGSGELTDAQTVAGLLLARDELRNETETSRHTSSLG